MPFVLTVMPPDPEPQELRSIGPFPTRAAAEAYVEREGIEGSTSIEEIRESGTGR